MNIENNVRMFLSTRKPSEANSSFDFCFNYFSCMRKNIAEEENIVLSCLHLGFYLASWGMYRGSCKIRNKSFLFFKELMHLISQEDWSGLWEIDVDCYNSENNLTLLMNFKKRLKGFLNTAGVSPTPTLTSKIMLGLFGNIPAFDEKFKQGSRHNDSWFGEDWNRKSLEKIHIFYWKNREEINNLQSNIYTINSDGQRTEIKYTKAKIIDMAFFVEGGGLDL